MCRLDANANPMLQRYLIDVNNAMQQRGGKMTSEHVESPALSNETLSKKHRDDHHATSHHHHAKRISPEKSKSRQSISKKKLADPSVVLFGKSRFAHRVGIFAKTYKCSDTVANLTTDAPCPVSTKKRVFPYDEDFETNESDFGAILASSKKQSTFLRKETDDFLTQQQSPAMKSRNYQYKNAGRFGLNHANEDDVQAFEPHQLTKRDQQPKQFDKQIARPDEPWWILDFQALNYSIPSFYDLVLERFKKVYLSQNVRKPPNLNLDELHTCSKNDRSPGLNTVSEWSAGLTPPENKSSGVDKEALRAIDVEEIVVPYKVVERVVSILPLWRTRTGLSITKRISRHLYNKMLQTNPEIFRQSNDFGTNTLTKHMQEMHSRSRSAASGHFHVEPQLVPPQSSFFNSVTDNDDQSDEFQLVGPGFTGQCAENQIFRPNNATLNSDDGFQLNLDAIVGNVNLDISASPFFRQF